MFILLCILCYVDAKRGLIFGNFFFFGGDKQACSGNLGGTRASGEAINYKAGLTL